MRNRKIRKGEEDGRVEERRDGEEGGGEGGRGKEIGRAHV